jgi:acyl-CoA thioesterase-1
MTDLARQAGIRVVLASILPVTDAKKAPDGKPIVRSQDRPPEAIRSINTWMAGLARRQGLVYLDYHPALADAEGTFRPELTDDGLHPNRDGYALMAPLAEKAITRALGHGATAMRTATR